MDANEIMNNEVTEEIAEEAVKAVQKTGSGKLGWFAFGVAVGATTVIAGKKIIKFVRSKFTKPMAEPEVDVEVDVNVTEEDAEK